MEDEAYEPVRLHAPNEHFGDREGEVGRQPQLEAERMRGVVRKVLSREKHPVVEDPRASQKRPIETTGEPRDQSRGDPVWEPPDDACEHRKKKGTPKGTFFRYEGAVSRGRSPAGTSGSGSYRRLDSHNASPRPCFHPHRQRASAVACRRGSSAEPE